MKNTSKTKFKQLNIYALLGDWIIPDGNYNDFVVGENRSLAFMVSPYKVLRFGLYLKNVFKVDKQANVTITGEVIYLNKKFVVIKTNDLKFFIERELSLLEMVKAKVFKRIQISGKLSLDYYIWKETFSKYSNVPDIYYNSKIVGIKRNYLSDDVISKTKNSISYPSTSELIEKKMLIQTTGSTSLGPHYDILRINISG